MGKYLWAIVAALLLALVGATAWKLHTQGSTIDEQARIIRDLESSIEQSKTAAAKQSGDWAKNVVFAIEEGNRREATAKHNAAIAAGESVRLRNTVEELRSALARAPEAAVRKYASTADGLLVECSERYTEMAAKAQSHYLDTVKLLQAWPK